MIVQINLCQVFYVSFYCFLDKVLYKGKKQVRRGTYRESENLLRSIDI